MQRMEVDCVSLKLLNTTPEGNRKPGRPITRWKDRIELDD